MTVPVWELQIRWSGDRLIAHQEFKSGFRDLSGTPAPKVNKVTTACADITDLTQFELGVFLAEACRPFTILWGDERPWELAEAQGLFEPPKGEV